MASSAEAPAWRSQRWRGCGCPAGARLRCGSTRCRSAPRIKSLGSFLFTLQFTIALGGYALPIISCELESDRIAVKLSSHGHHTICALFTPGDGLTVDRSLDFRRVTVGTVVKGMALELLPLS